LNEGQRYDCVGIITTGRTGFSDTHQNITESMHRFGFPMHWGGGAYWEQGLTGAIKGALAANPTAKYLLFFDGDSIWDNEDLAELYRIIEIGTVNGKTIDAVYPTQADRHGEKPLAFNWPDGGRTIQYGHDKPFMPDIHGHFGLTLIRRTVFETLPEPWLMSQPGDRGTWQLSPDNPGKMDADTFFWYERFHKHRKLAVRSNRIVIGHMQMGIRWQRGPDVIWQRIQDYRRHGKPIGCRAPRPEEFVGEEFPSSGGSSTGASIDGAHANEYAPPVYASGTDDGRVVTEKPEPPKPEEPAKEAA